MLKTLITLVRGRTALVAEELGDQNALLILDQQMRDATLALERAKKALAVAVAEKLSAKGFGPRLKPNAADVLVRLRERAGRGKPEATA